MGLDTSKIRLCPATMYIGTAGATPATDVGYIMDDGIEIEITVDPMNVKTANVLGKVTTLFMDSSAKISGTLLQAEQNLLGKFIPGVTVTGNVIAFPTTGAVMQTFSIAIVGINENGVARRYEMLYAEPGTSFKQSLAAGKLMDLPFEANSLSTGTNIITITDTLTDLTKTLATGVLTLDAGQTICYIAGEGGVADSLTSISQAGVANGDRVLCKIAAVAGPITCVHLADTLEMKEEVDVVFTALTDYWVMEYSTAGTKWSEIGRSTA